MNTPLWTTSPVWTAAGWTMLHLAWIGAPAGLLAALGRRGLRSSRPETRYAFALGCLALFTLLPVPIFAWVYDPTTSIIAISPGAHVPVKKPAASTPNKGGGLPAPIVGPGKLELRLAFKAEPDDRSTHDVFEPFVAILPWVWLAGSATTLLLLATGFVGVERLRRSSRGMVGEEVERRCRALAESLGVARRVGVAVCDRIAAPLLVGIVRPLILLPPAALGGWSVEQLEMALLHELAHLRRWDNLVNLAQRVVEALLFFHPLVWWLSAWVRLERESCCDRLVVERTESPLAYAEMLVTLAGSRRGGRGVGIAMAEGQVMTRVRRLLNLEDRTMTLTMPEGLGLLGAVVLGGTLMVAAYADPKPTPPKEQVRSMLQKAIDDVAATKGDPYQGASRAMVFQSVAEAQLKLGDRQAGLATLQRAVDSLAPRPELKGSDDWEILALRFEFVELQRKAGDKDAARRSLDQVADVIRTVRIDPAEVKKAIEKNANDGVESFDYLGASLAPIFLSEFYFKLGEERRLLGDQDGAIADESRALAVMDGYHGPMMARMADDQSKWAGAGALKASFYGHAAEIRFKRGDKEGARELVERARQIALSEATEGERELAMTGVVEGLAKIGDLDGALRLAGSLVSLWKYRAFRKLIEANTKESHDSDDNPMQIRVSTGAENLEAENPEAARRDLPQIAGALKAVGSTPDSVRLLAMIAHLQAKVGDFDGASATAMDIPVFAPDSISERRDAFYHALRPVTLAIIAHLQSQSGQPGPARDIFRRALVLARAKSHPDERILAEIIITRDQIEAGIPLQDPAQIPGLITEATARPEPSRSRCLSMIAELQLALADAKWAAETVDSIPAARTIEKVDSLERLGRWYETSGDAKKAAESFRQALQVIERGQKRGPDSNPTSKSGAPRYLQWGTSIPLDVEWNSDFLIPYLESKRASLLVKLGDVDGAIKAARSQKPMQPRGALWDVTQALIDQGNFAKALDVAATIEDPETRLGVIEQTVSKMQGDSIVR